MRLGIIARCDNTGLGNQTFELVKMLDPDLVILIDSSPFKDTDQYPERYRHYNTVINKGFINNDFAYDITKQLDVILTCETFYNDNFINIAKQNNCKTVLQYNYELFPNINNRTLPLPDVLIAPSLWYLGTVKRLERFGCRLIHIPPPSSPEFFYKNISINQKDHNRILHIRGTGAAFDRNGTTFVIDMLKRSRGDYELVIKTQTEFIPTYKDSRLIIDYNNENNHADLYQGFDLLLLPRRYGGLCLPMNEALLSGMPVMMPNIEPNSLILPKEWLLRTAGHNPVNTKNRVNAIKTDTLYMANIVDKYILSNKEGAKSLAYDIGYKNFSPQLLKEKYLEVFNLL